VPTLHAKYWKIYSHERRVYTALKAHYAKLRLQKLQYYTGKMSEDERKTLGWPPQNLKILVREADPHLDGDEELVSLKTKLEDQDTKMKLLEDIIKSIGNRGFLVKTMVDYQRFSRGEL
jgi:hypothetical protein